jgi:hypothetical protein
MNTAAVTRPFVNMKHEAQLTLGTDRRDQIDAEPGACCSRPPASHHATASSVCPQVCFASGDEHP